MNKRSVVWLALAAALMLASLSLPLSSGPSTKAVLCGLQVLATVGCLRLAFIFMAGGAKLRAAAAIAAALVAAAAAAVTLTRLL